MQENYTIITHNNNYYLHIPNRTKDIYLCEINELNSRYVKDMAEWQYEDIQSEEDMKSWKEKCNII